MCSKKFSAEGAAPTGKFNKAEIKFTGVDTINFDRNGILILQESNGNYRKHQQ